MSWNAAAVVVAACVVVGAATLASGGCIPDLPLDSPQPTALCGDGIIELDAGETCDPGQTLADASVSNCANCKMQCPGGLLWLNNHCYQLQNTLRIAQIEVPMLRQLCPQGHLATFASEEEFQAVGGYFDASSFWVGLETAPVSPATPASPAPLFSTSSGYISVAPYEPGWQPMCKGCYAHTANPNSPLPVTPDASIDGSSQDCVVALPGDPDASWHQYPCSASRPFASFFRTPEPRAICELEPVGVQSRQCEAGICIDLVKTYGAKRYVFGAKPVSATDAPKACVALGGRLVVLKSAEEREQLWRELSHVALAPSGAWGVWIGLAQSAPAARRSFFTAWVWDDGVPDDGTYPSPWGIGQGPSAAQGFGSAQGFGAGTTRAFLWHAAPQAPDDTLAHNDQPSSTLLPYVCEISVETGDAGGD